MNFKHNMCVCNPTFLFYKQNSNLRFRFVFQLKRFDMGRKRCLQFYIVCQIVILPLYLGFLFNCPTQPFAGVNLDPNEVGLSLDATCNQVSTTGLVL
jgi:hypothetical protein